MSRRRWRCRWKAITWWWISDRRSGARVKRANPEPRDSGFDAYASPRNDWIISSIVIARSTPVRRSPPSGEGGCDEAIHSAPGLDGLLRFARNDAEIFQRPPSRRSTRGERGLQEIAAGRGFPVQHFAGG